jgi:hypothetical protein
MTTVILKINLKTKGSTFALESNGDGVVKLFLDLQPVRVSLHLLPVDQINNADSLSTDRQKPTKYRTSVKLAEIKQLIIVLKKYIIIQ